MHHATSRRRGTRPRLLTARSSTLCAPHGRSALLHASRAPLLLAISSLFVDAGGVQHPRRQDRRVGPFSVPAAIVIFSARVPLRRRAHRGLGLTALRARDMDGILREHHRGAVHRRPLRHPASAHYSDQAAYARVLGESPRLVLASLDGLTCREFLKCIRAGEVEGCDQGAFSSGRAPSDQRSSARSGQRSLHLTRIRRPPTLVGAHHHHPRRLGRESPLRGDRHSDHLRAGHGTQRIRRAWTHKTATPSSAADPGIASLRARLRGAEQ